MAVISLASMSTAGPLTGPETFYGQQSGTDVKVTASQIITAAVAGGNYLGAFTVALLPAAPSTGSTAFATNGRKIGEGSGSGTGVPVYFHSSWRTFSSDQPVAV
jgi:hypothetical protein